MSRKKRTKRTRRADRRIVKKWFFLFTILYALVIVIGSTYAWVTMADERINRVATTRLEIEVEGNQAATVISPNTIAEKDIAIRNISTSAGFIRVSLEEVLLTFEMDTDDRTGNGNVAAYSSSVTPEIEWTDTSTWNVGKTFKKPNSVYFKGDTKELNVFDFSAQATGRGNLLRYIELTFPNTHLTIQSGVTGYWLYENGYFYFSEIVKPNEVTTILVKQIQATQDMPNLLKHSFYGLDVSGEGYSVAEAGIEAMGLTASDLAYQLLESHFN